MMAEVKVEGEEQKTRSRAGQAGRKEEPVVSSRSRKEDDDGSGDGDGSPGELGDSDEYPERPKNWMHQYQYQNYLLSYREAK